MSIFARDDMDMDDMPMGDEDWPKTNRAYAKGYWYFIAASVALFLVIRTINFAINWSRVRKSKSHSVQVPTKPTNRFTQSWATLTALCREMSYPQLYIPIRGLSWMTPPPMGRIFIILIYWAVVAYMMAKDVVIDDINYFERIGYRNAWVAVTQLPLLYLLASRANVIALITGTSYERLNWLHRWVARTMFVSVTCHGWFFWTEWVRGDMVEIELSMMRMVRYGIGAWGVLLWMVVSSFKPFRSMAYEFFVIQHVITAVVFLWAVYRHVPDSAKYNVWFAVASICFDRAFRLGLLFWQNIKLRPNRTCCEGGQWIGHLTKLSPIGESITVLTIKDVHFKWSPGQHLYLWLPRMALFEVHPYTIASAHPVPETCICNSIQLVVRSHSGFSKRLNKFARKLEASGKKQTLTALVVGPYGNPPRWDIFETLVFISASTGASYTLPVLENVLKSTAKSCIKRVDFLLAAKQGEEISFYHERLHDAIEEAKSVGVELSVHIAVTGEGQAEPTATPSFPESSASSANHEKKIIDGETQAPANIEIAGVVQPLMDQSPSRVPSTSSDSHIHHLTSRPDVAGFIKAAVEVTGGETGVVVCGGQSLVAKVRTSVAKLSDERAVHKGTGAQGIYLHVEEYCF
ncbi:ferric reductase like transmembrane component-domain-containing protein [Annulohypoxylon maeteangense]|uniref:ferric reductase like transmembrane component-domain-containing protein n=1 Tax=Annulohypoxylon maeteangense TaxID=1927788 RepID=UPI0020078298|nr:ferric reductase like transmembrane component-domain-containing protein [Annulohypoxylon maeteangense]KAI0883524.1 ferric reductase like transmembrane component-domain-containing protein [Annulohypoxylon maeteangense]